MPRKIQPLTDAQCRALRFDPNEKSKNVIRDGDGLILEVLPTGRKVWRLRYRSPAGKENRATFASDYPGASLADARSWRAEMRGLVRQGIDPNQRTRVEAQQRRAAALSTFGAVVDEWIQHKSDDWAPATADKVRSVLGNVLMPYLRNRPVGEITPQELLHCLQRFEKQGKRHMAHTARTYAGQVFRRAIVLGLRADDPAAALHGALKPKNESAQAHLSDPEHIGGLLRAIDGYSGSLVVRAGLRLLPLVFSRPGELRAAWWSEFDLAAARWDIPADRMKMGRPHSVPLSGSVLNSVFEPCGEITLSC